MKKRFIVYMTAALLAVSVTACGQQGNTDNADNNQTIGAENQEENEKLTAVGVLEAVWEAYSEEDKPIVVGGDSEHSVDGAPGEYDIADVEGIDSMFHITKEAVDMTDEAASAVHAMNANTFTSAVFHLKDAAQKEDFAASVKESVLSTRWMCGFPEKLVILSVKDAYVISAFGNGEMLEDFKNKVTEVYGEDVAVLAEENIE